MEAAAAISNVTQDQTQPKPTKDLDASPESSNSDSDYVTNSPAKSSTETASPTAAPGAGAGAGAGRRVIEEHHFENRREVFRRIETMKPEVRVEAYVRYSIRWSCHSFVIYFKMVFRECFTNIRVG